MSKILIVEDEASIRKGLTEILRLEGFEVMQAVNGAVGANLAREYLPDLIISDVLMPEMNGHQLLEALSLDERTRDIPFIIISALADRDDLRKGMNTGADDYLTKPFTRAELLQAIQSRLQKKARQEQVSRDRLEELRRQIITHVPHELLTPLNSIIGFSDVIANEAGEMSSDEIARTARIIRQSGERLHSLVMHYLTYLELVTNSHSMVTTDNAITDILPQIRQIAEAEAACSSSPFTLKSHLTSAGCRIGQKEAVTILSELISNAFKFSEQGATVEMAVGGGADKILVEISNTGRTVPVGASQKAGAFVQFDRDYYEQQGSGLGLAIATLVAERNGANIQIESFTPQTTTVRLTLPAG